MVADPAMEGRLEVELLVGSIRIEEADADPGPALRPAPRGSVGRVSVVIAPRLNVPIDASVPRRPGHGDALPPIAHGNRDRITSGPHKAGLPLHRRSSLAGRRGRPACRVARMTTPTVPTAPPRVDHDRRSLPCSNCRAAMLGRGSGRPSGGRGRARRSSWTTVSPGPAGPTADERRARPRSAVSDAWDAAMVANDADAVGRSSCADDCGDLVGGPMNGLTPKRDLGSTGSRSGAGWLHHPMPVVGSARGSRSMAADRDS